MTANNLTVEISQERLEKFWKRWGWYRKQDYFEHGGGLDYLYHWPYITLDNLFKYAVPAAKVSDIHFDYLRFENAVRCIIYFDEGAEHGDGDTPALALFVALEKLESDNS